MQHPLTSAAMLAAVLGTAFSASFLSAVGVEFFVVIDKAHLFVLLAFYGSLLALLAHFITRMARAINGGIVGHTRLRARKRIDPIVTKRSSERTKGRGTHDEFYLDKVAYRLNRKHTPIIEIASFIIVSALIAITLAPLLWTFRSEILEQWSGLLSVVLSIGLAMVGVLFVWASLHPFPDERTRVFGASVGQLLLLMSAVVLGRLWFGYLAFAAPALSALATTSEVPVQIRIVGPATEGILAVREGQRFVVYIPWQEIRELRSLRHSPLDVARPEPKPNVPTPPDTVGGTN